MTGLSRFQGVIRSLPPLEISALIAKRDRAFGPLIKLAGPPPRRRAAPVDDRFAALIRSITFQLLATKAANTIHQRVIEVCEGEVSVHQVISVGPDRLRGAGLSRTKAQAMVELAESVASNRVGLSRHGRMTDAQVVADVSCIRGIGPWTAQMYLMSTLARHDVWPTGDFGVRNGWTLVHGLDELVSEADLRAVGADFEGVRSALAWYCWRAVDLAKQSK